MEILSRVITLNTYAGVAPVRKTKQPRKGVQYERCNGGTLIFAFHVANLMMMIYMFIWYINRKIYYHPNRLFQVKVLMYTEITQVCSALICTLVFRFPNMPTFLSKCIDVTKDLGDSRFPLLVRHGGYLAMSVHTLVTTYRIGGSIFRLRLLGFFWIGISHTIMIKVLMFTALALVDKSFASINKDLQLVLTQRLRESSNFLETHLSHIRERYSRADELRLSIEQVFGPDMLCSCFFFVFKISFLCYHIYYKEDMATLWRQNTLVGELSGYFMTTQLLIFVFCLTFVCDNVSTKRDETYVLLLCISKSKIEKSDFEIKSVVKAYLLQVKSRRNIFDVCKHFTLNREMYFNMVLEAVTYVYMLIQLNGLKIK